MEIRIGNYDVLDTGTIVSNIKDPIDFIVKADILDTLRLVFKNEGENKNQSVKAQISDDDPRMVILNFTNYNNPFGTASPEPIPLGKLNGRPLFLNFRVYGTSKKSGVHIHYTWLLGKEGKDE